MAFHVEIEPQAFDDLDSIADYIKARSGFASSEKWFNGIMDEIATLKEMPGRCSLVAELSEVDREARVLLHGRKNRTYKVYFSISFGDAASGVVRVFHVRHWARRPVDADELQDLMDESEIDPEGTVREH